MINNNSVQLVGKISGDFQYNHSLKIESFYTVDIDVARTSGTIDRIPLMVSDRIVDIQNYTGCLVSVTGMLRSYNEIRGDRKKLVLSVFVRDFELIDDSDSKEHNWIDLDGFICMKPIYRKTPAGREIADIMLAVNRQYGRTDYIPCIAWSRNARFSSRLIVGTHIFVSGRIQSREYTKKINDTEFETRTAYEVSVCRIEEEKNDQND